MSKRRKSYGIGRVGNTFLVGAAVVCSAASSVATAHADEPRRASEPRIMAEPGEVTNVVDAFDEGNPFDIHVTLGFQQSFYGGKIRRESSIPQGTLATGNFTSPLMNVAQYKEVTSRLNTRIDVGLFRDIGFYLRMPLILSNSRELSDLQGSSKVQSVVLQGAPGEQLFSLPFKSPNRSGIEYLAAGLDFGIFNQARDASKPTWVFGFEGRFNVSEPMHACNGGGKGLNQGNQQVECADPSDIDRDGKSAGDSQTQSGFTRDEQGRSLEGSFNGGRKAGVSRGTTTLEVHTMVSRRIKYLEPYGGFRATFEFPTGSSDYGRSDVGTVVARRPPIQGWFTLGTQVIPYELREKFQRLTFDFRFTGTYRSEGRDYSPLFDAIGSSDAPSLRRPTYAQYRSGNTAAEGTQSVVDPGSQKIFTSGLTDVGAYGGFTLSTSAQFQAGEYIKFQVGGAYSVFQSHFLTGDQPCDSSKKNDVGKSGPCQSIQANEGGGYTHTATGQPSPVYRAPIDAVGRRFKLDDATQLDLWINAVVMF
jgi:hypothetical protein